MASGEQPRVVTGRGSGPPGSGEPPRPDRSPSFDRTGASGEEREALTGGRADHLRPRGEGDSCEHNERSVAVHRWVDGILGVPRAQQTLIAILVAVCLLLAGVQWYRYGGGMIEPVDIERDPPLPYDYRIDINRADWVELSQLPGVGPVLARRIVAERSRNGPFADAGDLQRRVRGVGPQTLARIRDWIRFDRSGRRRRADPVGTTVR
ncbi:MAG: helix-hairpin-helix domain-containing protein [Planctomycetota bacterium]|nr:MAG: helix-hairpin-helix domain-containing protein [Planctomycetota bacterium]